MQYVLEKVFKKNHGIVIGAIHFPPMPGYAHFPGFDTALENALFDLHALQEGGVDGIIFENNYDIPHTAFVSPEVMSCMMRLGEKIKEQASVPVGVSVLWNDYTTALSIAKKIGLQFIRVPVFVDTVKTSYGIMQGNPEDVIAVRKNLKAEEVALFTDIHVKHSEIISPYSIEESAQIAIQKGSDAIIITGKWTGDAPLVGQIEKVRNVIGDFPILCGSGIDHNNIQNLFQSANGAIVSTSLKTGANKKEEVNIKPYEERIDIAKVKVLTEELKK